MTLTETLKRCHEIVWTYRRELEHVWPTPSTEDALLFAFTELGEAIDAHLRSKPEYARNRDKDMDVLDELADCAMMLLTALGPEHVIAWEGDSAGYHGMHDWREYVQGIHMTLNWAYVEWGYAESMIVRISMHPGMDLPARLTARLERIKAKRLEATHG